MAGKEVTLDPVALAQLLASFWRFLNAEGIHAFEDQNSGYRAGVITRFLATHRRDSDRYTVRVFSRAMGKTDRQRNGLLDRDLPPAE